MACACSRAFGRKPCVRPVGRKTASSSCFEAEGIKLASLCSDVLGKSGRAILHALLEGQMSAPDMADLALGALRAKRDRLERALTVALSDNATWVLAELLTLVDSIEKRIERLDERIAKTAPSLCPGRGAPRANPGLGLRLDRRGAGRKRSRHVPSLPPPNT